MDLVNRRVVAAGVALAVVAVVGWAASSADGGESASTLAADFDAHAGEVRVLALLSPT